MTQIVLAGIILCFSAAVQSAVGFGFGLFCLTLLLTTGYTAPQAIAIIITGSIMVQVYSVSSLRRAVDWRQLAPMMVIGALTLPLGIITLLVISDLDKDCVKQLAGLLVLTVVGVQQFWKVKPVERLRPAWGYLAAAVSGFLSGSASIGGPPIILWAHAHRWPPEKLRVTMMGFCLPLAPIQVAIFMATFGSAVFSHMLIGIMLVPTTAVGTWAGLRIGKNLPEKQLRLIVQILLCALSLYGILGPYVGRCFLQ
jgi:uncharacterized protein